MDSQDIIANLLELVEYELGDITYYIKKYSNTELIKVLDTIKKDKKRDKAKLIESPDNRKDLYSNLWYIEDLRLITLIKLELLERSEK